MALALKAEPDWRAAAAELVAGLEARPSLDSRVDLIDRCRAELGDQVYPAFIKLLAAVAHYGDVKVRALVAEALAHAISTARLPSAQVPAWGGSAGAGLAAFGGLRGAMRSVGPIEFLCIWLHRDVALEALDDAAFERALTLMLRLFEPSPAAAKLYLTKLRADAASPVEGLHNHASRRTVQVLADAWEQGAPPQAAACRALASAQADRAAHRWNLPSR